MNLTNTQTIKKLCREYGIRPSHKLGQNFLINKYYLDKMIKAGELKKDDIVLEIGPGFGTLTVELLKNVKQVVTVEKDKRLCEFLQKNLRTEEQRNRETSIKIINNDILKITNYQLLLLRQGYGGQAITNYKIISNLPYLKSSLIITQNVNQRQTKTKNVILLHC